MLNDTDRFYQQNLVAHTLCRAHNRHTVTLEHFNDDEERHGRHRLRYADRKGRRLTLPQAHQAVPANR